MNVYRVICDSEIGSRYLEQLTERGGYTTHVEEIAPASGDYQEMVPASELAATREALVKADERATTNRTLAYTAQNKTAKVLDTVRDYIIVHGEESFPDGFVDAMVAQGMEPLVGTRELTITFAVLKKFMVTLDNVPASVDDDDLVTWLSRIDVDGDESASHIDNRITQELRMEDQVDIEVCVSDDHSELDDFNVEMA
jgi:hypothetical protein